MANQNFVPGAEGGTHISGAPLTTALAAEASPDLLQNSIDERIVKIRPMATPIDQLSRCAGARMCGSMTVEYFSVDTKETQTTLAEAAAGGVGTQRSDEMFTHRLRTNNDNIFDRSETILVPEVRGFDADGNPAGPLVLYVYNRPDDGGIEVAPVNGCPMQQNGTKVFTMPLIPAGTRLVRMGRAATELDVQTPQFAAMPRKASNNCQIFKMQVEQSTMMKIADKEVGWNFSDQEEAAIIDMRLGIEKNFLFGARAKMFDAQKNEPVYFTGGIWHQTTRETSFDINNPSEAALVSLCCKAFTKNAGSKRKILVGGTRLIEAINKIQTMRITSAADTYVRWGIEFKEVQSNFGSLYVLHSEVFDQCGHESDGFILDPDYLTKYVHVPFNVETLDLRRSGVRNTDAVVLTEASCLVLRYPNAHMRVIGSSGPSLSIEPPVNSQQDPATEE